MAWREFRTSAGKPCATASPAEFIRIRPQTTTAQRKSRTLAASYAIASQLCMHQTRFLLLFASPALHCFVRSPTFQKNTAVRIFLTLLPVRFYGSKTNKCLGVLKPLLSMRMLYTTALRCQPAPRLTLYRSRSFWLAFESFARTSLVKVGNA